MFSLPSKSRDAMNRRKRNRCLGPRRNMEPISSPGPSYVLRTTGASPEKWNLMQATRREVIRSTFTAGLIAGLPAMGTATPSQSSSLKVKYAKLDAAASQPGQVPVLLPTSLQPRQPRITSLRRSNVACADGGVPGVNAPARIVRIPDLKSPDGAM